MIEGEQARWRQIREIFEAAVDADSNERPGVVAARCQGDPELRRNVEELLMLRKEPGLALDRPPVAVIQQHRMAAAFRAAESMRQSEPRYPEGSLVAGRYQITRLLAHGGMGEVYEARDRGESREVALKFVRRMAGQQEQLEARFSREVRMAQKIEHPNVCRTYDLAQHEGERFCAMELLHGETLAGRLTRGGKFTPQEALPIALQLCDGLAAAHRAGVVHRDLKPSNVFLEDGRAVLIDFGLAATVVRDKALEDSLTATGAVIGTMAYMAPEQLEEDKEGPAADLYSLGVILFEMLTGGKPHDARSPFRLAAQKAREAHRTPMDSGTSGMPAIWREVITRSLKVRPEKRYASAGEMGRALERKHASAAYVLGQRRVWAPMVVLTISLMGWSAFEWARRDHVARPEAARLYNQASDAMTTASPTRAVKLLEQAIELDSKYVSARALLAIAHAETDQADRAKDALLQAIAAKEQRWLLGRAETLELEAANAAVVHGYLRAAEFYRQLSVLPGRRDFAQLSRARMLAEAGHTDEAITILETALDKAPKESSSPAARVELATLLSGKVEYDRAATEFAKAQVAYEASGNLEGLCDLRVARALRLRTQSNAEDRGDLEAAIELSTKTGNRYQNLTARLGMVTVAEREHDYNRAISVAREVATDAQREGMLAMAASATADLGYAYVYLQKHAESVPILRESVELAERAKSYRVLAANRLRLGEELNATRQSEEAIRVLTPAVQWYRQAGRDDVLPLVLIKWATVLTASLRFPEAEGIYAEAYRLAEKGGEGLYQSMVLQRLASLHLSQDPRRAAEESERAIKLAQPSLNTGVYFQAARAWAISGEFTRARELIAAGEKDAIEKYPAGTDQERYLNLTHESRGLVFLLEGHCDQASAELRKSKSETLIVEHWRRRARACGSNPSSMRSDLAWLEKAAETENAYALSWLFRDAGDLALRLKDWPAAKRYALQGVNASKRWRVPEMENKLVLRAAEAQLGNRVEADRLTAEVLKLAAVVGFEKPAEFGGRQDLLHLWKLGNAAGH